MITDDQEEYQGIHMQLVRNVDCIIILYSLRDRKSYQDALEKLNWLVACLKEEETSRKETHEAREQIVMFVGGMCEEPNERDRVVSRDEGVEEAKRLGVRFGECPAKTGEGVDEAVVELVRERWRVIEEKKAGERTEVESIDASEKVNEKGRRSWGGRVAQLKGLLLCGNGKKEI